ncbi:MAG: hypothetical protein AN482_19590 [Anabaena sp. LE011-02]|nr:MAG: hypothetical protein AN482_19590 [Anabaena sp. LE011-02]
MQQSTSNHHQDFIRQLITLVAVVGAFVVNVASNIFPLNGLSIGVISNTLFKDVLIIPANYPGFLTKKEKKGVKNCENVYVESI